MSAVDLHPEDLLDRSRRGVASAEERQRLAAHLADCRACRFEAVLAADCAAGERSHGDGNDGALMARVRAGARQAVRAELRRGRGGATRRRPARRSAVVTAAGALLLMATVAAAATAVRRALVSAPPPPPPSRAWLLAARAPVRA